jgi:hypothetical protein
MKTKTKKTKITKEQATELAKELVENPTFMQFYVGDTVFPNTNREYYNLKMLGLAAIKFKVTATAVLNNPRYTKNRKDIKGLITAINQMTKVYTKVIAKLDKHPDNCIYTTPVANRKPGDYKLLATCTNPKFTKAQLAEMTSSGIELGYGMIEVGE